MVRRELLLLIALTCDFFFFFFNDTATTEIYTLSLHDALPISRPPARSTVRPDPACSVPMAPRSEEHTSELQSPCNIVCRLLLEKKKKILNSQSLEKKNITVLKINHRNINV